MEYRAPKILGPKEMFKWWFQNKKKTRPHLKMTNAYKFRDNNLPSNKKIEIISINKEEITYLKRRLLEIDTEIIELEKSDLHKWYFTETTYKISGLKKETYTTEEKIKKLEKEDPDKIKVLMEQRTFNKVIKLYNKKAVDALVNEGKSINIRNNLGYLYLSYKKKADMFSYSNIDWSASNKYKQELIDQNIQIKDKENPKGKNWFQFYKEEHYIKAAWVKLYNVCKVPNNSVYAFYPGKGENSLVHNLVAANKENEYLKEKYILQPRIKKVDGKFING